MFVIYKKKGDKPNAFVCLPVCLCVFSSVYRAFEGFTLCVAGGPKTEEPYNTTESNADGRRGDRPTQKCVLVVIFRIFLFSSRLFCFHIFFFYCTLRDTLLTVRFQNRIHFPSLLRTTFYVL